ncbi:MAG: 3-dehydroquinate synthase family protein [Bdellovibrionota bacterium]
MPSELIYVNKPELIKVLDNHQDGEFYAIADYKIKNHLPQWIQFATNIFWVKEPEEDKNLSTYGDALEFFLKAHIHRSSVLYVFGGGATTDLGGFVAATILRGIPWVAVPSTLLAMIDGSLGGKTAVNTPSGKNLAGAFHEPQKVYLCSDFLTTLNEENWLSGKGEIVKYGLLSSEIYELICNKEEIGKIAEACAKYKMAIVKEDPKEEGDRILLNLGHTLGHAFESTLKVPHGLAVLMGLKYIFEIMNQAAALEAFEKMLKALDLPENKLIAKTYPDFDKKKIFDYILKDKKRSGEQVKLILVKKPGHPYVENVSLNDFKSRINKHVEFED